MFGNIQSTDNIIEDKIMTTLFDHLQEPCAPQTLPKQTIIWNGKEYENPLFEGFEAEFSFNKERSELTISLETFYSNSSFEQNERFLGKFVINLEQLSVLYRVPQSTLFTLLDEKIIPVLSSKHYDYQWRDDFSQFLTEKHQDWGDEWSFVGETFRFNSPFIKTNIDTIIQELMSSLIEFACK